MSGVRAELLPFRYPYASGMGTLQRGRGFGCQKAENDTGNQLVYLPSRLDHFLFQEGSPDNTKPLAPAIHGEQHGVKTKGGVMVARRGEERENSVANSLLALVCVRERDRERERQRERARVSASE